MSIFQSDHCPILLDTEPKSARKKKGRSHKKFELFWMQESDIEAVVHEAWNNSEGDAAQKLNSVMQPMSTWGKARFGNLKNRIEEAENSLLNLQNCEQTDEIIARQKEIEKKLVEMQRQYEAY